MNFVMLCLLVLIDVVFKYVVVMGGMDNVIKFGKEVFDKGEFCWCVEIVDKVVFVELSNK